MDRKTVKTRVELELIAFTAILTAGFLGSPVYTKEFRQHHKLCLSILKRFGFGQRLMETRILLEVEAMIARIQAQQSRSFDIKQVIMSSVVNVVMDMAFGHRFDHSCREFQQLISDSSDVFSDIAVELEIFPMLRHLPYYKKREARNVATMKRICDYINFEIAACHEVCHRQKFSCSLSSVLRAYTRSHPTN